MTHLADPFGALQALLVASRAEGAGAAPSAPSVLARPGALRLRARTGAAIVTPGMAALLARVMAQIPPGGQRPVSVQFLPCCATERVGGIANSLAGAASVLLGRTLLLDAHAHERPTDDADLHQGPLPDAFLPGLYHRRIGAVRSGSAALFAPDVLAAHAAEARQFRFIVVDSPASSMGGVALALAPRCAGSVLVVLAGVTRLATVRAAAADVKFAGGRLLGTVLADSQGDSAPMASA